MYAPLIIIGLIFLFTVSYLLNKNTERPIDITGIESANCQTCANYGCALKTPKEAK